MDLSLKASSSKRKKSKEETVNSDKDTPKYEEMDLFVRYYNRCLKRNKLNHPKKGLINFKKYSLT